MTRKAKTPAATTGSTASSSFADSRDRLDAMAAVADRFASWRPAGEVLTCVRAVPTVFPQVDEAIGVGGWPVERVALVHGPSNEGKTAFAHGLGLSFLQRSHFYLYCDAEFTTPALWTRKLMAGFASHPGFRALRPENYEQAVDGVREFCDVLADAKAKGELDPTTSGLVVIDSLRKLVPKKLLANIMKGDDDEKPSGGGRRKKSSHGVDGLGGRAAQFKAALNAAWLDELVPMLARSGAAVLLIAREAEDPDAGMFDEGFRVGGGRAVVYDSSLVLRIVREKWVREGTDENARVVGERHMVEVRKTKVAGKTTRRPRAYFHTSNGELVPEGFDRARDVIELALDHDVATLAGSWVAWGKRRLGNGLNAAVKRLHDEPELLVELEAEVRARFVLDTA